MLKVGIIGTGAIAHEHAAALGSLPGSAKLVAASDLSIARLAMFSSHFAGLRTCSSSDQLIQDPEIDLIAITTPPAAHEEITIAALTAGKFVLCEKPLAHSLASARRIADTAAKYPGRLAVSHQLRFDPQFKRLLWIFQNKRIGNLQSALLERHGMIPATADGKQSWWGDWQVAGGGVLMTQMIHQVDLLILAIGMPDSVRATMDTRYTAVESEDWVEMTLNYASGASATCRASVNSGRQDGCFVINGESGAVELPWKLRTNSAQQYQETMDALNLALPEGRSKSPALPRKVVRKLTSRIGWRPTPELSPHALLYKQICESIDKGDALPIGPIEAMKSLEVCLAAYESAITGAEIHLPLESTSQTYHGCSKHLYATRPASQEKKISNAKVELSVMSVLKSPFSRELRIGLVGMDTTHATTFASILNDPFSSLHIPGARVVAGYPGGSPDMEISRSRVAGFTAEARNMHGVEIMRSPEQVADACDLIFLLACDGRVHAPLFRSLVEFRKPVFVDKPFATTTADAEMMFRLADDHQVKIFSSSAFRYAKGLVDLLIGIHAAQEEILSCEVHFWLQVQPTQGRYFWYGVHAAEMLLAVMGPGLKSVEAKSDGSKDRIAVEHCDGRLSTIVGSTDDGTFSVKVITDRGERFVDLAASTATLSSQVLWAALDVLTNGKYPRLWSATAQGSVSGPRNSKAFDPCREETLDIVRLLDAAQRSHENSNIVQVQNASAAILSS